MDKYQSPLNSIKYLINECYKNHRMKYTHNMFSGTGSWEENDQKHRCLLASFTLWPPAFNLLSHAHWLFYPSLPSTHGGLILMLRSHVAIDLYLHRDRREAFLQITCSHGDCRAMVRLICFFKQNWKFKYVTGTVSPCHSTPHLFPYYLSLSCRLFPS